MMSSVQNSLSDSESQDSPPNNSQVEIPIVHKVDYEKLEEFKFQSPPECPVFRPTEEEFAMGALEYIQKIRHEAEKFGICKIIPPPSFKTPFALDESEFRFKPRVQRINTLEATTRVKLNFHDNLFWFWHFQGVDRRYPRAEKRLIDLYQLHQLVKEDGGLDHCNVMRKWPRIADQMGFTKNSASVLKQTYEKYLFPYDLFLAGATFGNDHHNPTPEKQHDLKEEEVIVKCEQTGELKKIRTFGAGPRMPTADGSNAQFIKSQKVCLNCQERVSSSIFTCDGCQNSFHRKCLFPEFTETPKNRWHCHGCLSKLMSNLPQRYTKDFGFIQAKKTYTLNEFRDFANGFKRDYFNSPPTEVPLHVVEKEFWRLAASCDDHLDVEYGADLHTNDYGSGFPTTRNSDQLNEKDKIYIDHPWNLNNLPTSDLSVFKHINTNISGMIIPWMYVGMCFSAFCWHNEDHWTYSINYLHWGEPKTWYGVPGGDAEVFEDALKKVSPALFSSQPDLLHLLTTTCNPNSLQEHKVQIYKANQEAGQFVVTFPRSYHAGFNQGLNFAEAVNFAPVDWLNMGRQAIADYASLHRFPVFSHDELICKMADDPKVLDIRLAEATYEDAITMLECEKALRIEILNLGITQTQRNFFEKLEDDSRQCDHCKTTTFLSALKCQCEDKNNKLVCLYHHDHLCKKCPPDGYTLVFRYTLDELKILVENLGKYLNEAKIWAKKIEQACNVRRDTEKKTTATIEDLKTLAEEGKSRGYSVYTDQFQLLNTTIAEANEYSTHAASLINFYRQGHSIKQKITYEKFHLFVEKVFKFCCNIPEQKDLEEVYNRAKFVATTIIDLSGTEKEKKSEKLVAYRKMIDAIEKLKFIDFGIQLENVKLDYTELDWFERINKFEIPNPIRKLSVSDVEELIEIGLKIPCSSSKIVQKIKELKKLIDDASTWLENVNKALNIRSDEKPLKKFSMSTWQKPEFHELERFQKQFDDNESFHKINLEPSLSTLASVILQAKRWNESAKMIHSQIEQSNDGIQEMPLLKNIEELLEKCKSINCKLDLVDYFENCVSKTKSWIENLADSMLDPTFKFYKPVDAVTPRNIEFSKSFTARNYHLMLMKKPHSKDNLFEQKLKGEFSGEKVQELYALFVNRESVFFEMLRESNMEKRNFIELSSKNDPEAVNYAKKFCICAKDTKDNVIECQLCLDWFHVSCINISIDKATKRTDKLESQKLFLCSLCTKGKRLKKKEIELFLVELNKLPVRFIEGELLKLHKKRIDLWYERLHEELQNYPELKMIYNNQSNDYDIINDEIRTILEDLLFQVFILGFDSEEIRRLWKIFLALNPKRKTVLFFGGIEKKRRHPSGNVQTTPIKKTKKNASPKAEIVTKDEISSENTYEYVDEPCALAQLCKNPTKKPIDWVLCEKCNLWYHQVCQGVTASDIEDIAFYCHACKNSATAVFNEDVSIVTM